MPVQFLDQWKQPVSKQTLPIRIKQKVILFLQDDPKSPQPVVDSADPEVLKVEEKSGGMKLPAGLRRFEITALQDAETVDVWALPDDIGLKVTDQVTFMVLNTQEAGVYYRQKVIEVAQSMLGCHYLWGAAGASPDQHNGMPGRPGAVFMYDSAKHKWAAKGDVMNHVAVCMVSNFNTCAGKAFKLDPPSSYIADPRRKLTDEDMAKETEKQSYRAVYKSYGGGRKGTILGERCEGIRHFDCVGFVNYCLSTALGDNVQYEISGTTDKPNTGFANQAYPVTKAGDDLPGDILIYRGAEKEVDVSNGRGGTTKKKVIIGAGHIGFSLGNGKGRIHASETEYGVITDTTIGSPIRRVRYPRLA